MARFDPHAAGERLKAFAHSIRLMILQELVAGPRCVSDMEELLPARQANISQHLAVLRNAQLVDYAQDGTLRCYYLCQPRLVEDMLALVGRKETVVKRSAEEIQSDKKRLAKALEKQAKRGASKRDQRAGVSGWSRSGSIC